MLNNDNKQKLVAEARAFYKSEIDSNAEDEMMCHYFAAFAERHATDVLAAERVKIGNELERITNGSSCEINRLIQELQGKL